MIPQEWFLCIFARTLPWPSVLRVSFWSFDRRKMLIMSNVHHDDGDDNEMNDKVWDMFCCEGVKVLFRVALVLIKHALPRKVQHHSHRHPLQQHNSLLFTHPVVRSPNHYFWPPIGEPYYPSPRQTFLQTQKEFCQFKSNVSLKLKSNAPGSPALPVNVRNIGGAETPARSHCSGGLSHPRGAKLRRLDANYKNAPPDIFNKFKTWISQVLRLDVTEEDMEREHRSAAFKLLLKYIFCQKNICICICM